MQAKTSLIIGASILLFLMISYFITIPLEQGPIYYTTTPLLGLLIFYQPVILGLYITIGLYFFINGLRKKVTLV